MQNTKNMLFSALLLTATMGIAHAEMKWNMATPYSEGLFHTKNIQQFVKDIASKTDGELDISVHSGASLYKAPEIFKAVRSGQVEMGELLISSLGNDDPLFKIDTLPFIATDYKSAQKLWSASKSSIAEALEKKGAILLYTAPWPGQNFYTTEAINDASYFKGKKLRSYNATTAEVASNLGASPTTVEVSNIPQAFSTGQIDAMITSSATGVSSQSWDYVSNYTRVNAWLPKNMVFMNKKTWSRLDEKTQNIILAAAAEAEKRGWEMSEDVNAENEKTLAENGIAVAEVSESLKATLQSVGTTMSAKWIKATGTDGQAILDAYNK